MDLYLAAKTNIPDVFIDFIEVQLKNGEVVSLNWDESNISRCQDGFDAFYKGVYFGEDVASGRIKDLEGLSIKDIGLYFETTGPFYFRIDQMHFKDQGKGFTVACPVIPDNCSGMSELKKLSLDSKVKFAESRPVKDPGHIFLFEVDRSGDRMGKPGDANNVYYANWFEFYSLDSSGELKKEKGSVEFSPKGCRLLGGGNERCNAIQAFADAHPGQGVIVLGVEYSKANLKERVFNALYKYEKDNQSLMVLSSFEKTSIHNDLIR